MYKFVVVFVIESFTPILPVFFFISEFTVKIVCVGIVQADWMLCSMTTTFSNGERKSKTKKQANKKK